MPHTTIISQTVIGWRQVSTGHIATEWKILQGPTRLEKHNQPLYELQILYRGDTLVCIHYIVEVWEQQNADVHGKLKQTKTRI